MNAVRRLALLCLSVAAGLTAAPVVCGLDEDPAGLVRTLGGDDVQARYDAYRVLLAQHPPEALPLLAKAVPAMPLAAQTFGVSVVQGYPAAVTKAVYERWLGADGAYVRLVAGFQLARAGEAKGVAAVVETLGQPVAADVLSLALSHAYGLRDPAIVKAVRGLVTADAPPAVLGPVLYHLQSVDDREAPRVVGPLLSSAAVATRMLAAAFLWRTGDEARAAELAAAIASPELTYDTFVRANGLLSNGPRLPEPVLAALLGIVEGAREGWFLSVVIEHLGRWGYAKAAPALRKLLDDAQPAVGKAAFEALSRIPGGLTADAVRAILTGADEARRVAAADLLRRADDRTGFDAVVGVLRTGTKARAEAARVLGAFRTRAGVEPLVDALLDPDLSVRAAAETGLEQTLYALFPYRRLDVATTGYRAAATPEANRAAVDRVRAWWVVAKDADW